VERGMVSRRACVVVQSRGCGGQRSRNALGQTRRVVGVHECTRARHHTLQIMRLDILLLQQLGPNDLKRSHCSVSPAAPQAGFWWSAAQRYRSPSVTAHTVTACCMGCDQAQLRPRCVLRRTRLQVGRTRSPARHRYTCNDLWLPVGHSFHVYCQPSLVCVSQAVLGNTKGSQSIQGNTWSLPRARSRTPSSSAGWARDTRDTTAFSSSSAAPHTSRTRTCDRTAR
jgi:hypothetical protein